MNVYLGIAKETSVLAFFRCFVIEIFFIVEKDIEKFYLHCSCIIGSCLAFRLIPLVIENLIP